MAKNARRVGLISAGVAAALTVVGSVAAIDRSAPSTAAAQGAGAQDAAAPGTTTQAVGASGAGVVDASVAAPGVPRLPAGARVTGHVPGSAQLHLSVNLKPRDPRALQAFVAAVSTPGGSHYHRYLAKGQFAAEFGPTRQTLTHVEAVLRGAGLTVGTPTADGLSVPVSATAAQIAHVFGTGFDAVKLADGTHGYANTEAPVLPAGLADAVSGLSGLSDVGRMRPHHTVGHTSAPIARPTTGTHVAGAAGYTPALCSNVTGSLAGMGVADTAGYNSPASIAAAYGLGTSPTTGAGQTVAVFELESVDLQAIKDYQACLGTSVPVNPVYVGKTSANHTADDSQYGVESALDIEDLVGLLPGATQILDYEGQDFSNPAGQNSLDVFRKIVQDDKASVISTSWGLCEANQDPGTLSAENTVFAMAAAQGQTVVAAAGDSGSSDCYDTQSQTGSTALAVDDPGSQPYVTAVGGTWMNGSGSSLRQGVWNNTYNNPQGIDAGGGGVSTKWAAPAYQGGFSGRGTRTVPDVSALADPDTGYPIVLRPGNADQVQIMGGTSAAAPTWAALIAEANASSACKANARPAGFVNPALYDVARTGYGSGYSDITSGSNNLSGLQPSGYFHAGTGYDLASGLGTPKLAGLVGRICAPSGTAATGPGTFHPLTTPTRFLDTYGGVGWGANGAARMPVPAQGTAPVKFTGRHGIPASGVTAVTFDVTVASANGGSGALLAYPDGSRPAAQQVFWSSTVARRTTHLTVQLPADGVVDFYVSNSAHLTVDVEGYWTNDGSGASYTAAAAPVTVLDTRKAIGVNTTTPASNQALTFKVTGSLPASSVKAVALNLTALNTSGYGYLIATGGGAGRPGTVNVSWTPYGGYVTGLAYVPVDPVTGTVTVYVSGTAHVTADLQGYFLNTGGASFQPLPGGQAYRVLDTRKAIGVATVAPLQPGRSLTFQVTGGSRAVPAGSKYVLLDLMALDTTANGGVVAYGSVQPAHCDFWWVKGQIVASPVLVPLSSTGTVTVRTLSTTDVIADVQGWFS